MVKVVRKEGPAGKRLNFILKNVDGYVAKVGYFNTAKYPAEGKRPPVSVAYVATIQEYGDPSHNIPARSFFRYTIAKQREHWRELANRGSKLILEGKLSINTLLENIANKAQGDIKERITQIMEPPLKESTKKAKKRLYAKKGGGVGALNKPLISYHGYLLNSVEYTVEKT